MESWRTQFTGRLDRCGIGNTDRFVCEADPASYPLALATNLRTTPTVVVITPTLNDADALAADTQAILRLLGMKANTQTLPELETNRRHLMPQNESERARTLNEAHEHDGLFFASAMAALAPTPHPGAFRKHEICLETGCQDCPPEKLAAALVNLDYDNEAEVRAPGEFSWRGGILDVYSPNHQYPLRLDYFGDELESIRFFDPETQRSLDLCTSCRLIARGEGALQLDDDCCFLDYFVDRPAIFAIADPAEVDRHIAQYATEAQRAVWERVLQLPSQWLFLQAAGDACPYESSRLERFPFFGLAAQFAAVLPELEQSTAILHRQHLTRQVDRWLDQRYQIIACTDQRSKYQRFLDISGLADTGQTDLVPYCETQLPGGIIYPEGKVVLLSDAEMFGRTTKRAKRRKQHYHVDHSLHAGNELVKGDIAVHALHGIARFLGIEIQSVGGEDQEVIVLEFQDDVRICVPLSQAYLVSRYAGHSKALPKLSRVGGAQWKKAKSAATDAIGDFAAELIRLQATRDATPGFSFTSEDPMLRDFEEAFPYEPTMDQVHAVNDVYADMDRARPMDRLICGDVGYGKTEVAMRAACKAVLSGKQVCVLVPTTVLAQQHFSSFRERFQQFPILIEVLSRFRTKAQQTETIEATSAGRVDILIGTHRLVQADISFKDLGLIIIDEEQRFGVRHKEILKQMRANVDVLTMTATPIPRTLYLSMAGLRDMSTIMTAPLERRPVETRVARYDNDIVRKAILHEIQRGGQIYFLHNRVKTINALATKLRALVPEARFEIGHGQMPERELEATMSRFVKHQFDVLVSTTIIESGLDIPNANTIIIDRADRFGLAELYQLRGRVGRFHRQAYAYLLLPTTMILHQTARERLAAIRKYTQLGAGFKLAMRDLEIRGSGNILGAEQSGHVSAIGFDMYCQLMKIAVARLRGQNIGDFAEPDLDLDFITSGVHEKPGKLRAGLSPAYIPEQAIRIESYRRLSNIKQLDHLQAYQEELRDRFGRLPNDAITALTLRKLRILAGHARLAKLQVKKHVIRPYTPTGELLKTPTGGLLRLKSRKPATMLQELEALLTKLADA